MLPIRPPAVAGSFYPGTAEALSGLVTGFLAGAQGAPAPRPPKALIVPHAGFVYSGPVAAEAYRLLPPFRDRYRRVVLLGPVHRVPVRGLALPGARAFSTPLGDVPVDPGAEALLAGLPQVRVHPGAHALEHSLEVQLPFLQTVLGDFVLVPLAVGDAAPDEVAAVADRLWGGAETLFVVSTDLSHYLPADRAEVRDRETARAIAGLRPVTPDQACGAAPVNGFLEAAGSRGLSCRLVSLSHSGNTAGGRDRVVGYGAFAFFEEESHDQ